MSVATSSPTVTVNFASNAQALYAAYASFLQYVQSHPPNVNWAGGGAGGGGGGGTNTVNNTTNVTNNYYGAGGGAGGAPGTTTTRGRGAGGLPLGRGITAFALFHAASQVVANEERYDEEVRAAFGDQLKLSQAGVSHRKSYDSTLGGVGRLGRGLRELDPFHEESSTRDVEKAIQAAQLAERKADLVQESMAFNRTAGYRRAEAEAGPGGSAQQQRQVIEDRYKIELTKIEEMKRERLNAIEEEKKAAIEAGSTSAEFNARDAKDKLKHTFDPAVDAADAVRKRQLDDLEYRQQQQALHARQHADIAGLEYGHRPQVADARELYNAGANAAERAKHEGNTPEAKSELEAAQFRLLHFKEMLQLGEGGGYEDNARQLDFSGTDNSIRLGNGGRGYDDTTEAIKESNGLLERIEKLLAKL